MANPPSDVSPSELFLKLKEAPPVNEVVPFPRLDDQGEPIYHIRMKVLTEGERQMAIRLAREAIKRYGLPKDEMDTHIGRTVQDDAMKKEYVAMACLEAEPSGDFDPPMYRRVFSGGKDLDVLTTHELTVLYNQYEVTQLKFGPLFSMMNNEDELNFWLRSVQEGAEEHPLLRLGLPGLVLVTSRAVRRVFELSRLLDSQFESLPESLAAKLLPLEIGTGFYGLPASEPTDSEKSSIEDEELVGIVSPEELERLVREQAEQVGLNPDDFE